MELKYNQKRVEVWMGSVKQERPCDNGAGNQKRQGWAKRSLMGWRQLTVHKSVCLLFLLIQLLWEVAVSQHPLHLDMVM
jgi:hypothetical protein